MKKMWKKFRDRLENQYWLTKNGESLAPSSLDICWICGSDSDLTREHRIKASDIRDQYGKQELYVISADLSRKPKLVQSANSVHLKFKSKICNRCNSDITQESDFAYVELARRAEVLASQENSPESVFQEEEFGEGGPSHVPLHRYFGKLLGCHLADSELAIPISLSRFVRKESDEICISLTVANAEKGMPGLPDITAQASHDGLGIILLLEEHLVTGFASQRQVGRVQYVFSYRLNRQEMLEYKIRFPEMVDKCVIGYGAGTPSLQAASMNRSFHH